MDAIRQEVKKKVIRFASRTGAPPRGGRAAVTQRARQADFSKLPASPLGHARALDTHHTTSPRPTLATVALFSPRQPRLTPLPQRQSPSRPHSLSWPDIKSSPGFALTARFSRTPVQLKARVTPVALHAREQIARRPEIVISHSTPGRQRYIKQPLWSGIYGNRQHHITNISRHVVPSQPEPQAPVGRRPEAALRQTQPHPRHA